MGATAFNKVWKSLVCAFALAMCLALAACGGNSGGSGSAAGSSGSSGASESSSAAADPAEKFVGDWKFAAAEMEGIIVTGDFSAGILGEDVSMTLTLAQDGTGSATFDDETADITWETTSDDAIAITPTSSDGELEPMTATYDDGVLVIEMDDDEFSGKLYLSADGTIEGISAIDTSSATDIASESDLVGTWKLGGMNMMGMSMYGDADDLAEQVGDSSYTTMEIDADGTASFMGEDATWSVSSNGATIAIEGVELPLKSLNGDLIVDAGSLMSEIGVDFDLVMLYTK